MNRIRAHFAKAAEVAELRDKAVADRREIQSLRRERHSLICVAAKRLAQLDQIEAERRVDRSHARLMVDALEQFGVTEIHRHCECECNSLCVITESAPQCQHPTPDTQQIKDTPQ